MAYKIGIPRALLYHYYYPGWEHFFKQLGMEVVLSPETNKQLLNIGVKKAVDDLCLPFKVYYGHVNYLINRADYIFVPRLISLGKSNSVCPKFMGLPDMLKATFSENDRGVKLPPLLDPTIDLRKGYLPLRKLAHQLGKELKVDFYKTEKAYWQAVRKQRQFEQIMRKGYTFQESLDIIGGKKVEKSNSDRQRLRVGVLGHAYIINDRQQSMDLLELLKSMGVEVITQEMIEPGLLEKAALIQNKKSFWYFNRQVMGAAYHLLYNAKERVDGLIQVTAFGCGPDSLIKELIELKGKKNKQVSLLNINVDEHTGQAGLITRLEAFVDLLERRNMA